MREPTTENQEAMESTQLLRCRDCEYYHAFRCYLDRWDDSDSDDYCSYGTPMEGK